MGVATASVAVAFAAVGAVANLQAIVRPEFSAAALQCCLHVLKIEIPAVVEETAQDEVCMVSVLRERM